MATPRRGRAAPDAAPVVSPPPVAETRVRPDAKAFQRAAQIGELYELPGCGLPARLRRPSLVELATRGTVPNPLAAEVLKLVAADENPRDLSDAQRIDRWQHNGKAFIEIAALCFAEPRMVIDRDPNYDAGEIGPGDLADMDYLWLYYTFVEGAAAERLPFRLDP